MGINRYLLFLIISYVFLLTFGCLNNNQIIDFFSPKSKIVKYYEVEVGDEVNFSCTALNNCSCTPYSSLLSYGYDPTIIDFSPCPYFEKGKTYKIEGIVNNFNYYESKIIGMILSYLYNDSYYKYKDTLIEVPVIKPTNIELVSEKKVLEDYFGGKIISETSPKQRVELMCADDNEGSIEYNCTELFFLDISNLTKEELCIVYPKNITSNTSIKIENVYYMKVKDEEVDYLIFYINRFSKEKYFLSGLDNYIFLNKKTFGCRILKENYIYCPIPKGWKNKNYSLTITLFSNDYEVCSGKFSVN